MSWELWTFDDARARGWVPFAPTRPVAEMLFGTSTLRGRMERVVGVACAGHIAPEVIGFSEPGAPPVVGALEPVSTRPRVVLSGRFAIDHLGDPAPGSGLSTLLANGRVVGWILPPGVEAPNPEDLSDPDSVPLGERTVEVEGRVLDAPWDLMGGNPERVLLDLSSAAPPGFARPEGVEVLGDHPVLAAATAVVEPGVVIDAREGPVRLEADTRVRALSRLEGPLWIGDTTEVLGGAVGQSSIGSKCKVRGEVEASVFLGFANKAHDGFLGHAIVGRWVNLGAMTTNSDLKNDYGPVRLRLPGGVVDTGIRKVGCFLGDHVKTGIGTLLNTGTVVGLGSNLFGGGVPPTWVPPFSWGSGTDLVPYRSDKFIEVARLVMERRGQTLSAESEALLRRAWEATRADRELAGVTDAA